MPRALYDPGLPTQSQLYNAKVLAESLSGLEWLVPDLASELRAAHPTDDILVARLRASYWSTQAIAYQPFITQLLQIIPSSDALGPEAHELATKAIEALVKSIRRSHDLERKLPNIIDIFATGPT
jgi:hypothetical protein